MDENNIHVQLMDFLSRAIIYQVLINLNQLFARYIKITIKSVSCISLFFTL